MKQLASPEVVHVKVEHEKLVTWDRAFAGWPGKLVMTQSSHSTFVTLKMDPEARTKIEEVDVEVLRQIVATVDALPPFPRTAKATKGDAER